MEVPEGYGMFAEACARSRLVQGLVEKGKKVAHNKTVREAIRDGGSVSAAFTTLSNDG